MAKPDNPKAIAGDNSGDVNMATKQAREAVKSYVERVERLTEEKDVTITDIKDIFAEAKALGYDAKAMRKVIARRKRDREEVVAEDTMIELIEEALGVFS
jgi:uncharacterized protein (UPF0335 family)